MLSITGAYSVNFDDSTSSKRADLDNIVQFLDLDLDLDADDGRSHMLSCLCPRAYLWHPQHGWIGTYHDSTKMWRALLQQATQLTHLDVGGAWSATHQHNDATHQQTSTCPIAIAT
jgi:hypothetical protein